MARDDSFLQYRQGDSYLHRLDPLTKLVGMLGFSFLAFGTYIASLQTLVTIVVLLIAFTAGRFKVWDLIVTTWFFGIACVGFIVIQAITLPPSGPVVWHFLGHAFTAGTTGYAYAVGLRIYTIYLVSIIFIRTTSPRDLAVSFTEGLKVPYRIAYSFFVAMRMIPLMQEEMAVIRAAQQVRGVGVKKGVAGRLQNLRQLMLPLLVRSMREAGTLVHSMEARGFGAYPTRTFTDVNRMGRSGKIISLAILLLVVAWYTLVGLNIIHTQYVR